MGLLPVGVPAITPAGTQIQAAVTSNYSAPDGSPMPTSTSNTVTTAVGRVGGVNVSPDSDTREALPGGSVDFPLTLSNAGNGSDTFDLTAATQNGWSVAIYRDDNGDGVRQSTETTAVSATDTLHVEDAFNCFATVTIPESSTAARDTVTFAARSRFDATKTANATLIVQKRAPVQSPYILSWLVNGYYPNSDRAARLNYSYLGDESSVAPTEGSNSGGKTWFRADTQIEYLDLAKVFNGATYCAGYVHAYVYSPAAQTVNLWMASDDGIKVWLNGEVVWNNDTYRGLTLDQDKTTVGLNEGWNRLLVKVSQGRGGWRVAVKFCDSSGNQIPGIVYSAAP